MRMNLGNQLVAALLGLGLAGTATADEHGKKGPMKDGVSSFISTETITGKEVWDFHGNKIGSIDSVLVKPAGGKTLLLVDADQWRPDEPRVAIPLQRFHVKVKDGDPDRLVYTLDTTKEHLKGAPAYEDLTDPDAYSESDLRSVYTYWKVKMGRAANATGRNVRNAAEATGRALGRAAEATEDAVEDAADAVEDSVDADR